MKKSVLILCKTNLQHDPRVIKQLQALSQDYNVTCVGTAKSMHDGVQYDLDLFSQDESSSINRITQLTKLVTKQYNSLYWKGNNKKVYQKLKKEKYDLILCNETESLPIAHRLAYKMEAPIYCDLHEYYLDDRQTGSFSKAQQVYEEWILTHHIEHVQHFTTVSPQLIDIYKEKYGIDCTLLDNACQYFDLSPTEVSPKHIRLVSHGAAIPARRLELMIEAVSNLDDRYSLNLYLMDNNETYKKHLEEIVKDNPRVNILPPIPFDEIQKTINDYDIGLYLLYPTHINNTNALPNKLFEFIQARLAVVIGPTPAMKEIVEEYGIGRVSEDFSVEALTATINEITTEEINSYKQNTNKAARLRNSENNIKEIRRIVAGLLN